MVAGLGRRSIELDGPLHRGDCSLEVADPSARVGESAPAPDSVGRDRGQRLVVARRHREVSEPQREGGRGLDRFHRARVELAGPAVVLHRACGLPDRLLEPTARDPRRCAGLVREHGLADRLGQSDSASVAAAPRCEANECSACRCFVRHQRVELRFGLVAGAVGCQPAPERDPERRTLGQRGQPRSQGVHRLVVADGADGGVHDLVAFVDR